MKDQIDKKVDLYIRVTRNSNEARERAVLVAKDEKGNEYVFTYNEFDYGNFENFQQDLTVCDYIKEE